MLWPEHPETFSSSKLIGSSLAQIDSDEFDGIDEIPQLYTGAEADDLEDEEMEHSRVRPGQMNQSRLLYKALRRTCQSVWRQKDPSSTSEIDPHLSHVISRRCAFLLQTVLGGAHLNRRSAVKLLQRFPGNGNLDLDNVPVNWEDLREAARQNIGQAALDQNTFVKFKIRLEKLFKNK